MRKSKVRKELEAALMWSTGYGYGICSVGNMMMAALSHPDEKNPDWPSVVTVSSPPEKYTDDELRKLVEFSKERKERTERYDRMFNYRMGANLIVLDKMDGQDGRWLRKRQSWYMGPMFSQTLDEALEVFRENGL